VLRDNVLRHINSVVRTIASNIARTTETLFLVMGPSAFQIPFYCCNIFATANQTIYMSCKLIWY